MYILGILPFLIWSSMSEDFEKTHSERAVQSVNEVSKGVQYRSSQHHKYFSRMIRTLGGEINTDSSFSLSDNITDVATNESLV